MEILNKEQFIKHLERTRNFTAYCCEQERFDGVCIAPPGCFGSYVVRIEPDNTNILEHLEDTAFDADYEDGSTFIVYDKEDIQEMIGALSLCLTDRMAVFRSLK